MSSATRSVSVSLGGQVEQSGRFDSPVDTAGWVGFELLYRPAHVDATGRGVPIRIWGFRSVTFASCGSEACVAGTKSGPFVAVAEPDALSAAKSRGFTQTHSVSVPPGQLITGLALIPALGDQPGDAATAVSYHTTQLSHLVPPPVYSLATACPKQQAQSSSTPANGAQTTCHVEVPGPDVQKGAAGRIQLSAADFPPLDANTKLTVFCTAIQQQHSANGLIGVILTPQTDAFGLLVRQTNPVIPAAACCLDSWSAQRGVGSVPPSLREWCGAQTRAACDEVIGRYCGLTPAGMEKELDSVSRWGLKMPGDTCACLNSPVATAACIDKRCALSQTAYREQNQTPYSKSAPASRPGCEGTQVTCADTINLGENLAAGFYPPGGCAAGKGGLTRPKRMLLLVVLLVVVALVLLAAGGTGKKPKKKPVPEFGTGPPGLPSLDAI